jgi:prepilin-type N-terminal cleavage/methylation domain-containing protein
MRRRRLINKNRIIVKRSQPDGGFTIIESLLAIIVVGILLVGIAPVIALSVATRVQARRVESATQAARTYIEGTRARSIQAPNARVYLETAKIQASQSGLVFDGTVPSPPADALSQCATKEDAKTKVTCETNRYLNGNPVAGDTASLYCFDVDGDGGCSADSIQDMIVQAFRSTRLETPTTEEAVIAADASQGYILGVRVYRADAFDGSGELKASDATTNVRADTFAGGLGDRKAPLIEMTTDITVRGDITRLFANICTRLNSKGTSCGSNPTPSPTP